METLTRYCVFCGKAIPEALQRTPQGPRASCCPSCNTIDIYQYFRPCERARLRIEARKGRPPERGEAAPAPSAPAELRPIDGGDARKQEPAADGDVDVATLLPFRLGTLARDALQGSVKAESKPPIETRPPDAGSKPGPAAPAGREVGAEEPSDDVDGTVELPANEFKDEYVTMQIKRRFSARLVLAAGRAEPLEIPLREGALVLGGATTCDVILNTRELTISRRHALLRCTLGEDGQPAVSVEDLNSRNGTRVNGKRITVETRLVPGDEVTFADVTYRLEV